MKLQRGDFVIGDEPAGDGLVMNDGNAPENVRMDHDTARWLAMVAIPALVAHCRPLIIVESSASDGQLGGQLKIDS